MNKYCNYDCGVNHKTVIKEHLLQSFGKRQPTENLCAEESAGSFNAYLTDTACKLVEGTSEEICNARAENRKRQTRDVLIRAQSCCEKAENESARCCRCKGTHKRDQNQHERTRNFACCITGTFIEERTRKACNAAEIHHARNTKIKVAGFFRQNLACGAEHYDRAERYGRLD